MPPPHFANDTPAAEHSIILAADLYRTHVDAAAICATTCGSGKNRHAPWLR